MWGNDDVYHINSDLNADELSEQLEKTITRSQDSFYSLNFFDFISEKEYKEFWKANRYIS